MMCLYRSIAVLCALIVGRLIGRELFLAILFGTLGLFLAHIILRMRIKPAPYPLFVLLLFLGLAGEILAVLSLQCVRQDALFGAWILFVPTLFFLFFSHGIRGQNRKIWGIAYAVFLMLLYFYGHRELGETASFSFLPLQLSLLYLAIYSLKQKNDAS